MIPSTEFQSTIKTVVKRRLTGVSITIKRSLIAFQTAFKRRSIALLSAISVSIATALTAFKASSIAVVFTRAIAFIAFSVLTFFTPASLNAETYTDLDRAIAATVARQKPLMIVVMQTTCPYCKQFYEQTLNAEGVMQRLSQEFVIYESYLDKGGVFPTDFEWTGTVPTTYFVAPNGELIGQPLVGVIPLDQFIPYVSQVLEYFYQSKEAALRERYGR